MQDSEKLICDSLCFDLCEFYDVRWGYDYNDHVPLDQNVYVIKWPKLPNTSVSLWSI